MKNKPHILFEKNFEKNPYNTPKNNPISDPPIIRDRAYGNYLLKKLEKIQQKFNIELNENTSLIKDNCIYIEFKSEWGTKLDFDKFDKDGVRINKTLFQLLKTEEEERVIDEQKEFRYSLLVVVNESGVSEFIKKIKEFLNPAKDSISGNFSNQALLNNICNIEVATLKSFWVDEPEIKFPEDNENIWWEIWFRKSENYNEKLKDVYDNLKNIGCQIGQSQIVLTEYIVKLVKGTSNQLSDSLLLLDNLAELRSPQEVSSFITHKNISFETKKEYLENLKNRTDNNFNEDSVLICLLDTGINNKHPLLEEFVADENLFSYNEAWGLQDSYPDGGHGTGVAGLALYGDLTDALSSSENIQIYHGLESFKIFSLNSKSNPELYGAITESGVSTPQIFKPSNLRVFCLTITDSCLRFNGRPSSWSASIDSICFGKELGQQLFIVSGGNVIINDHSDYPSLNETECIHDPAQAYNALTIGAYTRKDRIDISTGYSPLAENGAMSPSNSTSLLFDNSWPNKPDLVFEGGNRSTNGVLTSDHSELRLLTTDADFPNDIFIPFGDTSGAAGLAAKMAAELRTMYPNYWVETIRGLMVHSANWTETMIKNADKMRHRVRSVGYGVPNINKALFSVENSLTLIAEREIQPYKYENSKGKYNEYHLFNLPWPKEALESLEDKLIKLVITLSYYIEPNPGSRRFASHYSYHSHQLDFEIINRNEEIKDFQGRISKPYNETKENRPSRKGVSWQIGNTISSKGSLRKDYITLTGREMSERNILAVFPKNGWYKNLKRQNKFNEKVRYSLIVSLETEELDVDLYTPVMNQINIRV